MTFDPTPYAIVDTETSGLDERHDQPWEIAIWRWQPRTQSWASWLFHVKDYADYAGMPKAAADVNGYFERFLKEPLAIEMSRVPLCKMLENILRGAIVVGSNPTYDLNMLRNLGCSPTWSHRTRDVPTLSMGLVGEDYGGLQSTAQRLGWDIDDPEYAGHTAMGDATLTRDIFMATMEAPR